MKTTIKALLIIVAMFAVPFAWAQDNIYYPTAASNGGQIIASVASTGACPTGSCVGITLSATAAVITVGVTGTFSDTLQPEESQNGGYTWTSAGTAITTIGTTSYVVAGFTTFRVRASAHVSGVANVNLQPSTAPSGDVTSGTADPTGATCAPNALYVQTTTGNLYTCDAGVFAIVSGGGGGGPTGPAGGTLSGTYPNPTLLNGSGAPIGSCTAGYVYTDNNTGNFYACDGTTWTAVTYLGGFINAKSFGVQANWKVITNGANFTVTSGSPNVACTSGCTFTSADVGKEIFATNWGGNDVTYLSSVAVVPASVTTILTVTDSTHIIMSQNATGNAGTTNTNAGALAYGTDDTAAWAAGKTAAYDGPVCLSLVAPSGISNLNNSQFNSATCPGISGGTTASRYPALVGYGATNSTILLTPWFDGTTCTGGASGVSCFGSAGSTLHMAFNGLGQSTIASVLNDVLFETSDDCSYEDVDLWGFAASETGTTGIRLNTGFHTFTNVEGDGWGVNGLKAFGVHLTANGLYIGNGAVQPVTIEDGAEMICNGCAYQWSVPTGTGILVLAVGSGQYYAHDESTFGTSPTGAGGAACYVAQGTARIIIDGTICNNTGNTNNLVFSAQNTSTIIAQNASSLEGGGTNGIWACAAGATCIDRLGNVYGTTPVVSAGSVSVVTSSGNGGTCIMTTTACTITVTPPAATPTPHCIATNQGTDHIAGSCSFSGTTITITAASSNTDTWAAFIF